MNKLAGVLLLMTTLVACRSTRVATPAVPGPYDATFRTDAAHEIWVAPPAAGQFPEVGTASHPYRSIQRALDTVNGTTLAQPVVIHVAGGEYRENLVIENVTGTRASPLVIDTDYRCGASLGCNPAVDVASIVGSLNMRAARFVYLTGSVSTRHPTTGHPTLTFDATRLTANIDNLLQCAACDHFLVRFVEGRGTPRVRGEILKVNQSTHVYVENADFSGSTVGGKNPIDFVAVQHGHIIDTKMHDSVDWCGYVKGGSSDIAVDGNEIYNCRTGGFSVGEGAGLEFTTSGYTRYEASAIRVTNNIIRNTNGAGLNVQGAYNALLAHNTLLDVGGIAGQTISIAYGERSCDGDNATCLSRVEGCGWGPVAHVIGAPPVRIPNRHIYVLNNVIVNTFAHTTAQIFSIASDATNDLAPDAFTTSGCADWPQSVSATNADIVFDGNLILNDDGETPWLGAADGCAECVRGENARRPALDDAGLARVVDTRLRPVSGSPILTHATVGIPDFTGIADGGATSQEASAAVSNRIPLDRAKNCRAALSRVGAYVYTEPEAASARLRDVCVP